MGPDGHPTVAGSLVWQARTEARLTQRQLAEAAQVPQSTIADIERGRRQPSIPLLQRILRAAGMEVRFVLSPVDGHDASLASDPAQDERVGALFRRAKRTG
jgi:transcriptional regulator with XRE-family HTH domain